MAMEDDVLVVYRYTFPADGAQYVGSCLNVRWEARAWEHKNKRSSNRVLTARLQAGEDYELERLSGHSTEPECRAAETAAILACARPLNKFEAVGLIPVAHSIYSSELERLGLPEVEDAPYAKPPFEEVGKTRRDKAPRSEAVCSVCRQRKPASEFPGDRCRFNGLGSKCYACKYYQNKTGAGAQEMRDLIEELGELPPVSEGANKKLRRTCLECGVRLEGRQQVNRRRCASCNKKRYCRRHRDKAMREHRCIECGKPKEAGRKRRIHCAGCAAKKVAAVQAQVAAKKGLGVCICCGAEDALPGLQYCAGCREKVNACGKAWLERKKEQGGWCSKCRCVRVEPGGKHKTCPACLERNRARKAKLREELRCSSCGREIEHHLEGSKCCARCRDQARERMRRLYKRRKDEAGQP